MRISLFNQWLESAKRHVDTQAVAYKEVKNMIPHFEKGEETAKKWQTLLKKKIDVIEN